MESARRTDIGRRVEALGVRAVELLHRLDGVLAELGSVEGQVVEPSVPAAGSGSAVVPAAHASPPWKGVAVVVAAAVVGAMVLGRRR